MILVSNCPARPTNGSPWRSSSAPGASPHEDQPGVGIAHAEDGLRPRLRPVRRSGTGGHLLAQSAAERPRGRAASSTRTGVCRRAMSVHRSIGAGSGSCGQTRLRLAGACKHAPCSRMRNRPPAGGFRSVASRSGHPAAAFSLLSFATVVLVEVVDSAQSGSCSHAPNHTSACRAVGPSIAAGRHAATANPPLDYRSAVAWIIMKRR